MVALVAALVMALLLLLTNGAANALRDWPMSDGAVPFLSSQEDDDHSPSDESITVASTAEVSEEHSALVGEI